MKILFFAQLKEVTGTGEIELPVATATDGQALWQQLLAEYPRLELFRCAVRLARNGEFVADTAKLHDHDEIALIPPVSGG